MDPEIITRIAESKIKEAIDEGKFDNLPGRGERLILHDDPLVPAHMRMANQILKNANVLPEWVQLQRDIEREREEIGQLRARLIREHGARSRKTSTLAGSHPAHAAFAAWCARSRSDYLRRHRDLNTLLLKLTLTAPSTVVVSPPARIETVMAEFDAEFPLPGGAPAEAGERGGEGTLRSIARSRYQSGSGGGAVRDWSPDAGAASSGHNIGPRDSEDISVSDAPGGRRTK